MSRFAGKPRAILAFGESLNDTKSLKELVSALRPDLPAVLPRERPIILRHGTHKPKLEAQASTIERLVKAENLRSSVVAVIAHRDLDDVESSESPDEPNTSEAALLNSFSGLRDNGIVFIPTVPAWEMEAWWFMWPEQVAKHRAGWNKLRDRSGKRVDLITDAKATFIAELEPKGSKRCPRYSETDSPMIAARVRQDGVVRSPKGRSFAFERFVRSVDALRR